MNVIKQNLKLVMMIILLHKQDDMKDYLSLPSESDNKPLKYNKYK